MSTPPASGEEFTWVPVWAPDPTLRPVRHEINNLLAPVLVAAELLDDGSDTGALLVRSAGRLRALTESFGDLLRLGPPDPAPWTPRAAATALELPAAGLPTDRTADLDLLRLTTNVIDRVGDLLESPTITLTVTEVSWPDGGVGPALVLGCHGTAALRLGGDLSLVPVPCAVSGLGVSAALVCREVHLQGGRVRIAPARGTLQGCFPLR